MSLLSGGRRGGSNQPWQGVWSRWIWASTHCVGRSSPLKHLVPLCVVFLCTAFNFFMVCTLVLCDASSLQVAPLDRLIEAATRIGRFIEQHQQA